jgi:ribosomal protein S18 acetylase RimI-like enzyme
VGLINVVGTVPDHRRRGLALALTGEALRRLRERGAASASLYVDASNPTRAYDLYRRLGFEVAYEFDVFEVSWQAGDRVAQTSNVIS